MSTESDTSFWREINAHCKSAAIRNSFGHSKVVLPSQWFFTRRIKDSTFSRQLRSGLDYLTRTSGVGEPLQPGLSSEASDNIRVVGRSCSQVHIAVGPVSRATVTNVQIPSHRISSQISLPK